MEYPTRLDEDGCIDLLSILQVVKQIDQEQAWAICYELCTLMKRLASRQDNSSSSSSPSATCAPIKSLSQVHLHKDGHVHEKSCHGSWLHRQKRKQKLKRESNNATYTCNNKQQQRQEEEDRDEVEDNDGGESMLDESNQSGDPSPTRTPSSPSPTQSQSQSPSSSPMLLSASDDNILTRSCSSLQLGEHLKRQRSAELNVNVNVKVNVNVNNEFELVASMGVALFWALDYEIPHDEERKLDIYMDYLISQSSQSKLSFDEVLELCEKRLTPTTTTRLRADSHYKSVCKSLVQDTIQLSIFLEKIYTASMVLNDISEHELSELGEPLASLRALKIDDWARLWMHVIKELKQALAIT